jgi:hypothetical protein
MDPTIAAIELTAVRWEQWLGAALRMQQGQALLAGLPRRRAVRRTPPRRSSRGSLWWMLAASVAGFWLLRG